MRDNGGEICQFSFIPVLCGNQRCRCYLWESIASLRYNIAIYEGETCVHD